tara:strand:- start:800 stop:1231 length:432 start_codon:yes stop_codon:yes gene_type:complete
LVGFTFSQKTGEFSMGADFALATFPYFDMTEDRRERFRELIVNLPAKETYEFQEWYDLDDEESYNLEELLEDIESSCSTVNRETATITTYSKKGERYELNVTGGMTWGDSPTDVYDAFNRAAFFENVYDLAVDCSVEYIKMYT